MGAEGRRTLGAQKGKEELAALLRVPLDLTDGTIDYEISFHGANRTSLRIEWGDRKGSFRIEISRRELGLTKNPSQGEDKEAMEPIARKTMELDADQWYPVRITFKGTEATVQVNDTIIQGSHPVLGEAKTGANFLVFGERRGIPECARGEMRTLGPGPNAWEQSHWHDGQRWARVAAVKALIFLLPGLAAVLGTGLYLFQDKLIYFPRPYAPEILAAFASRGGVTLRFTAKHGEQTAFYVANAPGLPRQIWCCFSGNGGQAWAGKALLAETPRKAVPSFWWNGPVMGPAREIRAPPRSGHRPVELPSPWRNISGTSFELLQPRFAVLGHSMGAAGALIAADEMGARRAILFPLHELA